MRTRVVSVAAAVVAVVVAVVAVVAVAAVVVAVAVAESWRKSCRLRSSVPWSGVAVDEFVEAVDEPVGVPERLDFQGATPIPQLECTDYPSCIEEYGVEIEPIDGRCMDVDRMPVLVTEREDCLDGGNYWIAGDFYANYGLGADVDAMGAYIQPFAFNWDLRFKNNYRGSGMPGIPATPSHLIDLYKFECEIRWTTLGGVPIPGVVGGGWPDKCILGHNTLESRGFFADATECDELYNPGLAGCQVDDNPPDAYRLWPIGSYKVEVLIDGEIIVQNVFSVAEFERPDPWPLDMPEERPQDHGGGPVYYSSEGQWPSGLPYGANYYLNNLDCIVEELCSVVHPWEYPLPYGSSGGAYEIRPLWGDYSVPIGGRVLLRSRRLIRVSILSTLGVRVWTGVIRVGVVNLLILVLRTWSHIS